MGKLFNRYALIGMTVGVMAIGALAVAAVPAGNLAATGQTPSPSAAQVPPGERSILRLSGTGVGQPADPHPPVLRLMPGSPQAEDPQAAPPEKSRESLDARASRAQAAGTPAPANEPAGTGSGQPKVAQNPGSPEPSTAKLSLRQPPVAGSSASQPAVQIAPSDKPPASAPLAEEPLKPPRRGMWHLSPAAKLVLDQPPPVPSRSQPAAEVEKPAGPAKSQELAAKPQDVAAKPQDLVAKPSVISDRPALDQPRRSPPKRDDSALVSIKKVKVKDPVSTASTSRPAVEPTEAPAVQPSGQPAAADPPPTLAGSTPTPQKPAPLAAAKVPSAQLAAKPAAPPSQPTSPPVPPADRLAQQQSTPRISLPGVKESDNRLAQPPAIPGPAPAQDQKRSSLKVAQANPPANLPAPAAADPVAPPRATPPVALPAQRESDHQLAGPPAAQVPAPSWNKPVPSAEVLARPLQSPPQEAQQRFQLLARICGEHIRYGSDLAARGATHSARQEFIEVLNRVSQALDHTGGNHRHSQALKVGLRALSEAEDFQTGHDRLSTDVDLRGLVATHQTQALKKIVDFQHLTPVMAMQSYLQYAKEQLVLASGQQPLASRALYSLARLETAQPRGRPLDRPIRGPRAIALHQASLLVDQKNYAAANELGVLLAHYGQLDGAGDVLSHAAKLSGQPETWHNLARVYELQGQIQKADHARMFHHRLLADSRKAGKKAQEGRQVYWVAPEAFRSHTDPLEAESLQSRMASDLAKTLQDSSGERSGTEGQVGSQEGQARRGALHNLSRLMKEKLGSRP